MCVSVRRALLTLACCCLTLAVYPMELHAQDTKFKPVGDQIPGPFNTQTETNNEAELHAWRANRREVQQAWLADIRQWRTEHKIRIGYHDSEYSRPEFAWTQRNFISPQSMVEDRFLYDVASRRYTVDRFLDDLDQRYGGIDSVLLWPVYPNIGIDNRNQWDLIRDMPGGVSGLRKLVDEFHSRHVRVLFPAMPWDTGTRDEGAPHAVATAKLMAEIGADGVNGDTFSGVPRSYREASDATSHPVAFEPELAPTNAQDLVWNAMSWAYWKYPFAPMVSKAKWIEPRHMDHVCNRWARDKTDDLQYAFFNGCGYVSWENVWGIWNGITPRAGETIRRIAKLEREFSGLLASPDWEPYADTVQFGVFASRFSNESQSLWTVVNRNEYEVDGVQVIDHNAKSGTRYFDLWHGVELPSQSLRFHLEPHGFGAILSVVGAPHQNLSVLLSQMKTWSAKPLAGYSNDWRVLPQTLVDIPSAPAAPAHQQMVHIPGGKFRFRVSGVEIEGDNWSGLDVQYPWESSPRRNHDHEMEIKPFRIDKYPVTNQDFKTFLDQSHYRPSDDHNFLKDWHSGTYPKGWERRPVTWVSFEDSRAYAQWAKKRLPHEWEWQYAAQGADGRAYPWGNTPDATAVPEESHTRELRGPSPVDAHAPGASPFGVEDMMGNVWQWTDEYQDQHTRAAILRGGSYYRPAGSLWYFPQNHTLFEHGKYLLMAPSKDRSGTVGFRCVADE